MGSVWLFLVLWVLEIPSAESQEIWKNLPGAPNQCEINGHCLQSPNFPQNYGPYEGCLVKLPPYSVILVMAFSTETRDMLVINGNAYSGDDDSMINRSFVIRPETDVISWVTDGSGSLSGWQLCLDTPPACSDGFPVPVTGKDCPSSIEKLSSCETAALGALCIGDGTCHTRMDIDNCGQADIYRKRRSRGPQQCYHRRRGKASHRRPFASNVTEDGDGTSLSTSTCTIPLWWTNETVWEKADDARCQVNGPCLESPNFPGRYNNSGTCVAVMPAFSAVTVTAFSTEQYFDVLIINQQNYSGTSRDIENKTFVIRPNSTNISWFPDSSGSRSGWQLCLDPPPACSDGLLVPVTGEDCPSSIENLSTCETAALGALCIGDGRCHTRMDIDNCGQADIYRKMRSKSNGSTFPYDPIPVLVGSAPRPSPAESRRRLSPEAARRRRTYLHHAGGEGGGYGYGVDSDCTDCFPEPPASRRRISRRRWTSAVIWNKIGENTCQVNDHCLESPHFPHYYPSESGCFAKLQEPFRLFQVTSFSTDPGDKLWINGRPYSGTDAHSITNPLHQSFLLESAIMWLSNKRNPSFGWQLCVERPANCSDGLTLIPVLQEECPEDMTNLSSCETTFAGSLCVGNGTCGTQDINNCETFSVYRKLQLQAINSTRRKPTRVEDVEDVEDVKYVEDLKDVEDVDDGVSILEVTYAVCGVVAVLICILVTMRCSQRRKAMRWQAEPVEQGIALPADFPGSWLMEWPDGQQVLTSISAQGRFEVERNTYDLTYLQQAPARLQCQGETLELIRCTENVWIWRASQSEKTYCWMRIRSVAHSLSMDFSKESVTFVCTSCQRPIEEACFWNYRPCESEESYLCRDCSGDSSELQRKSHVRGISARYLLDIFPDLARNGTEKADPNFYEIAPVLAMGPNGLGFQKVCPRDGQPGCSIVDAVDPEYQGLVTHFVSWCWSYKLNDFVSAIAVWAQKEEQNIDCIFLWICFFCNNQYRILESKCQTGSEQLRSVFEGHLAQAGQMLLMLDTFVKPSYMTRAWCIFEAFVCIDKDFPMTIILPERAQAAFIENLDMSGGFTLLKTAFETMDVRRARASSTADEDMIKKLVFTTSGFDVVNKAVKRRLLSWLTDQFRNYVDVAAEAINSQRSEGSQQTGLTHL